MMLSDNIREFCGHPDWQPYELFLQLEEIEHGTTRADGIVTDAVGHHFPRMFSR